MRRGGPARDLHYSHEAEDLSQAIQIDEAEVSSHLSDLVRETVQRGSTRCPIRRLRNRAMPGGRNGWRLAGGDETEEDDREGG
ncbi:MAG: hypothetical protein JW955_19300 [Sedimentisphaerales bacterium]|nr:hypothetical protein [Sedimentisphaerales bacterium]